MDERKWRWKLEHTQQANLLYEPGNWGDVLKSTWALTVTLSLQRVAVGHAARPFRLLDPFAGAPTYPLSRATTARVERIGGELFALQQRPFVDRDRIASTAMLVREVCRSQGIAVELRVFDADPERRTLWDQLDSVELLVATSGEEVLADAALDGVARGSTSTDLVVVDPYDFFDRWGELLPSVLQLAERTPVLVYLYNKSPRGPGVLKQYRRLQRRLRERPCPELVGVSIGRLPADPELPRAYHEMLLLAPVRVHERLDAEVRAATLRLARSVVEDGLFTEI